METTAEILGDLNRARLIESMPAKVYHADPAPTPSLSSGLVKIINERSMQAAFRAHPKLNRDYAASSIATTDMNIGTAAHSLLLESTTAGVVWVDAKDWRTNAAKEKRDEAIAKGDVPLLIEEREHVEGMVEAAKKFIAQSEIAADWQNAKSEQTIIWSDNGVWCRLRADRLTNDHEIILDYKTTEDASPAWWSRQLIKMGNHIQDAFYRRGVRKLTGREPRFVFLVQEREPPYECALFGCEPQLQQIADAKVELAIAKWRQALKTQEWSSYGGRVHWVSAPAWLQNETQEIVYE